MQRSMVLWLGSGKPCGQTRGERAVSKPGSAGSCCTCTCTCAAPASTAADGGSGRVVRGGLGPFVCIPSRCPVLSCVVLSSPMSREHTSGWMSSWLAGWLAAVGHACVSLPAFLAIPCTGRARTAPLPLAQCLHSNRIRSALWLQQDQRERDGGSAAATEECGTRPVPSEVSAAAAAVAISMHWSLPEHGSGRVYLADWLTGWLSRLPWQQTGLLWRRHKASSGCPIVGTGSGCSRPVSRCMTVPRSCAAWQGCCCGVGMVCWMRHPCCPGRWNAPDAFCTRALVVMPRTRLSVCPSVRLSVCLSGLVWSVWSGLGGQSHCSQGRVSVSVESQRAGWIPATHPSNCDRSDSPGTVCKDDACGRDARLPWTGKHGPLAVDSSRQPTADS
ncbi:hypothetical protein BC831DRAFT_477975 [Entophlyctis helioformis]|nr:hypothetical protein BC831DRAFT_477975 [Entophlyctis helioformis]